MLACTEPPDQTENGTDLKFGTHTLLDHTKKIFCFFEKSDLEGSLPQKTVVSRGFSPYISSIAL